MSRSSADRIVDLVDRLASNVARVNGTMVLLQDQLAARASIPDQRTSEEKERFVSNVKAFACSSDSIRGVVQRLDETGIPVIPEGDSRQRMTLDDNDIVLLREHGVNLTSFLWRYVKRG